MVYLWAAIANIVSLKRRGLWDILEVGSTDYPVEGIRKGCTVQFQGMETCHQKLFPRVEHRRLEHNKIFQFPRDFEDILRSKNDTKSISCKSFVYEK